MSSLFRKEKAPYAAVAPQKENVMDEEAANEAARREAEALRKRKGYGSTIVTGAQGVTGEATTKKALLGE